MVSFVTYFLGHPSPWPAISFDLTIESIVSVSERLKDECLKDSRNGILIELKRQLDISMIRECKTC